MRQYQYMSCTVPHLELVFDKLLTLILTTILDGSYYYLPFTDEKVRLREVK